MDMGTKIKTRRKELGLTLQEVADYLGCSRGNVQRYESGYISSITIETIKKLAVVLQTTTDYLMGWDEQLTKPNNFHIRLKKMLDKNNLTTDEFAEKISTQVPIVEQYLSGEVEPSFNVVEKMSDVLDVSVSYLVTGETEAKGSPLNTDMKLVLEASLELNDEDQTRLAKMIELFLNK